MYARGPITYQAQINIHKSFPEKPDAATLVKEIDGKFYRNINPAENEEVGLVDYPLNSDKFRSIEFSKKPPILTLGCSITFGVGLPQNAMWSSIISKYTNKEVATIAIPGTGIETIVSAAFDIMNFYDYKPEYILGLFPNLERVRYLDFSINDMLCNGNSLYNSSIQFKLGKTMLSDILPVEYVFYKNMSYIKMLEEFCNHSGIKLIWTCWDSKKPDVFKKHFKNYIEDNTINEFPGYGSGPEWTPYEKIRKSYYQYDHMTCHYDEEIKNKDYFYYAYDNRKPRFHGGFYRFGPHPGMHRNIHWAEQFYAKMSEDAII